MKVGDLVRAIYAGANLSDNPADRKYNVGFIVRVDRSPISHYKRYWVKFLGRGSNSGQIPFMDRQLEVVSKGS